MATLLYKNAYSKSVKRAHENIMKCKSKYKKSKRAFKTEKLIYSTILRYDFGHVVLLEKEDNFSTIRSAFKFHDIPVNICRGSNNMYFLRIGEQNFTEGPFCDPADAKTYLSAAARFKLRKGCFILIPKRDFMKIDEASLLYNYSIAYDVPFETPLQWFLHSGDDANVESAKKYAIVQGAIALITRYIRKKELRSLKFEGFTQTVVDELVKEFGKYLVKVKKEGPDIIVSNVFDRMDIVRRVLKSDGKYGGFVLQIPK